MQPNDTSLPNDLERAIPNHVKGEGHRPSCPSAWPKPATCQWLDSGGTPCGHFREEHVSDGLASGHPFTDAAEQSKDEATRRDVGYTGGSLPEVALGEARKRYGIYEHGRDLCGETQVLERAAFVAGATWAKNAEQAESDRLVVPFSFKVQQAVALRAADILGWHKGISDPFTRAERVANEIARINNAFMKAQAETHDA